MKILLVEDDEAIRSIAKISLTKVGGHDVNAVGSGLQALSHLATASCDLILLDVMMPELDGFETCKRLKADPKLKSIPVVFLTAKAQVHEVQHGLSLGAIGYIVKPFDPMTLPEKLSRILGAATNARQAA